MNELIRLTRAEDGKLIYMNITHIFFIESSDENDPESHTIIKLSNNSDKKPHLLVEESLSTVKSRFNSSARKS